MQSQNHARLKPWVGRDGLVMLGLLLIFNFSPACLSGPRPSEQGSEAETTLRLHGRTILPGITVLTGLDLRPYQTRFPIPELADPYVTQMTDSVLVSGTSQYSLKFRSMEDIQRGGPYDVVRNEYFYQDGQAMEGGRYYAHSWDMKPALWSQDQQQDPQTRPRLWNKTKDSRPPLTVWYGGHMRRRPGAKISQWPHDHYSRDVFAFIEKFPQKWFSLEQSVFETPANWPRPFGSFLGHRYGHQIVMVPQLEAGQRTDLAAVFYDEVTDIRSNGSPAVTRVFMDTMTSPYHATGKPVELLSPFNPLTGQPYPSAIREDGTLLVEGPLYFRFHFENEEYEAFGFSAGSFYGKYPAAFASRRVADGLEGKPYQPDLNDDGVDFHNAGKKLGEILNLAGGPARPAVIVGNDGQAIRGDNGLLQVLVHGYRKDILPDNDYSKHPVKYRLDQMFRIIVHAFLKVSKGPNGVLRFDILTPNETQPNWNSVPLLADRKEQSAPEASLGAAPLKD